MTILQPPLSQRPNLEKRRGAFPHHASNTGKAIAGIFDDMGELQRLRHEISVRSAGRFEHHDRAAGRCVGGQSESRARQAIEEEHRCIGERRFYSVYRVHRNGSKGWKPFAATRAEPGKPVIGPTILPASDLLNDDGCILDGSAGRPVKMNSPADHVPADAFGGGVAVHACDRIGFPSESGQNTQHVAARSARPTADWSVWIDTHHHVKGNQPCSEDLGSRAHLHPAALPACRKPGLGSE